MNTYPIKKQLDEILPCDCRLHETTKAIPEDLKNNSVWCSQKINCYVNKCRSCEGDTNILLSKKISMYLT